MLTYHELKKAVANRYIKEDMISITRKLVSSLILSFLIELYEYQEF
ncbi:hypothetical protein [Streptococcus pyogenes]|nr:hypothetical protein [Streptococcus pyogenes]HEQ2233229.1 hypothetical protein [Streptococcus pyogenes]HEQ2372958.1 hypothetical protein [Streptococcus pyogenes]